MVGWVEARMCTYVHLVPKVTALRVCASIAIMAFTGPFVLGDQAASRESLASLRARLNEIQANLDAMTMRIETLRRSEILLDQRLGEIDVQSNDLHLRRGRLEDRVAEAAQFLYQTSSVDMVELLLTAPNLGELSTRIEIMERVSQQQTTVLMESYRTETQLDHLQQQLQAKREELATTTAQLELASEELQQYFIDVSEEYLALEEKLAALAAQKAAAAARELEAVENKAGDDSNPDSLNTSSSKHQSRLGDADVNGMACPVAGVNSFIDSWGFPRSGGRTHEGTDMMAAFGTSVVAIVDGTITFEGYGTSAGNWLILSGDDGNSYWYMHNRENVLSGGPVQAGQKIATVGDTGNATGGPPHVHFEYHPGGGGPINPYSILSSIC